MNASNKKDEDNNWWISIKRDSSGKTDNDEEDEPEAPLPEAQEEPREDPNQSDEEDDEDVYEEAVENAQNENIQNEERRILRNCATLRAPDRYNDFINVDEILLAEGQEPISYEEAVQSSEAPKWREAINNEIESLHRNNVWELTQAPKGQDIIDNRWTFKAKRDANGNVQRYKARLVARGFTQRHGIDYQETFSPVVRFDSIRAILTIAARQKMKLQQFDVKTAQEFFLILYGNIDKTIYMR